MRKAMVAPTIHFKGSGWAKKERASSGARHAKEAVGAGADDGGHESSRTDAPAASDSTAKGEGSPRAGDGAAAGGPAVSGTTGGSGSTGTSGGTPASGGTAGARQPRTSGSSER
jgi:hypothetical protein